MDFIGYINIFPQQFLAGKNKYKFYKLSTQILT